MTKKLLLLPLLLLPLFVWSQQSWTVRSVPNTRLESDFFHVSNPDGIISDSCEQLINTSLSSIREKADVFVVALNSIGDADIEVFANELFNLWGIGDKDKDNGVLILLAKEQRQLKFEVGYGLESILTDARCQQIFVNDIVPFFKEGDYQSGLCSGVNQVLLVFGGTVPDGLITKLPSTGSGSSGSDDMDIPLILLGLLLLGLPFITGIYYLTKGFKPRNRQRFNSKAASVIDGVRYINESEKNPIVDPWEKAGCLKVLLYGFSIYVVLFLVLIIPQLRIGASKLNNWILLILTLFLYLSWLCYRQNMRTLRTAKRMASQSFFAKKVYENANNDKLTQATRKLAFWMGWIFSSVFKRQIEQAPEYSCAVCHEAMKPFDKFSFNDVQRKELELKSVSYQPYICQYGHVTVLKNVKNIGYHFCPTCGGNTEKVINSRIITEATYEKTGLKEVTHHCCYCNKTRVEEKVIPMLYRYSAYSSTSSYHSSSSSSHYHSSSSHKSGGSFGGGKSGGGGYKGSW